MIICDDSPLNPVEYRARKEAEFVRVQKKMQVRIVIASLACALLTLHNYMHVCRSGETLSECFNFPLDLSVTLKSALKALVLNLTLFVGPLY